MALSGRMRGSKERPRVTNLWSDDIAQSICIVLKSKSPPHKIDATPIRPKFPKELVVSVVPRAYVLAKGVRIEVHETSPHRLRPV